ncbi:hypothetical protein ACGFIF_43165 [Kribbella sp. NPDC049174]|uniref:hypothetical protein n=1 Tax=Kribbella sp. NPDC049174 TaxID=3364112 RepID=UPI0037177ED5
MAKINTPPNSLPDDGFSERHVLLLLLAAFVGFVAGMLAHWSGQSPAASVLVGGGAAGFTLGLAHTLMRRR